MTSRTLRCLTLLALSAGASPAGAQDAPAPAPAPTDPEVGDTGQWQTPPATTEATPDAEVPPAVVPSAAEPPTWMEPDAERPPSFGPTESAEEAGDETLPAGATDHSMYEKKFGFGLLAISSVPVGIDEDFVRGSGSDGAGNAIRQDISTPIIGIRYWFSRSMGLEIGAGFGYLNHTLSVDHYTAALVQDASASGWAVSGHAALPVVLTEGRHVSFLVIPTLGFGYGTTSIYGQAESDDQYLTGTEVRVGARAGAEMHFGFIGAPELAAQATFGANFSYWSGSTENQLTPTSSAFTTGTSMEFHTTASEALGDAVAASIAILYYVD